MENLIIIGNGFDLAHGLKTSYWDFYQHLSSEVIKSPENYNDIAYVKFNGEKQVLVEQKKPYFGNSFSTFWENIFLQVLSLRNSSELWSDLEYLYFKILKNYKDNEYIKNEFRLNFKFGSAQKVNEEFAEVKCYLEKYLSVEQQNFKEINGFKEMFDEFAKRKTTILNFNYTNTVQKYIQGNTKINLIHIHGELNNHDNPMIFGFAANDSESKELIDRNEDELLTNIKRINYKLTDNEPRLINFLDSSEEIEVFIFGHSCGISDRLILNQIFNHKNVKIIRPFYYKDMTAYRKTSIGIDRIIDDYSKVNGQISFPKLLNFPFCHPILQHDSDSNQVDEFVKYIKTILKEKEVKKAQAEANRQAVYSALQR